MNICIDRFDIERDSLNEVMFLPTSQILFDQQHHFTEVIFSMNTLQLVRFHDKLIRQELIPNYIEQYLLCNSPEARELTDNG